MGFVEPGCRAGLAAESLLEDLIAGVVGGQHLQGDVAVVDRVVGTPHLAHAATAQQPDKAIPPERRALHRLTIRSQPLHRQAKRVQRLLRHALHYHRYKQAPINYPLAPRWVRWPCDGLLRR